MKREDLIVTDELRDLLSDFCGGFNVSLTLLSGTWKEILSIPNRIAPPFCRKISGWLYGPAACTAQADRMRRLASDRADSVIYTCHAGCRCCVHPFVSSGKTVALATISGFRYAEEPSAAALRDWERDVGPADVLRHDFKALPRFSRDLENRMVRLFKVISDYAASRGLVGVHHSPLFEMIVDYVRGHVARTSIPINEVAEHVRKSSSTVSHLIKKEAGISFRRLVIEQKLRTAESMLTEDSQRSIGEVADSLGFSDQFYFSRLYKRYRGYPPREFMRHSAG